VFSDTYSILVVRMQDEICMENGARFFSLSTETRLAGIFTTHSDTLSSSIMFSPLALAAADAPPLSTSHPPPSWPSCSGSPKFPNKTYISFLITPSFLLFLFFCLKRPLLFWILRTFNHGSDPAFLLPRMTQCLPQPPKYIIVRSFP
jgi:hypothetical protein